MHDRYPKVQRLQVHEENQQMIYFNENAALSEILNRNHRTSLTEFFANNKKEKRNPLSETARTDSRGVLHPHGYELTYLEYPKYYVWEKKRWRRRARGQKQIKIGRMWWVSPKAGEKFYLRTLLNYVPGPTSFQDLKDGHDTYLEACVARGILRSDNGKLLSISYTLLFFNYTYTPKKS